MTATSLYIPRALLERLDEEAVRRGLSRNRLVIAACEAWLEQQRGEWPEGYLSGAGLSPEDLRLLQEGGEEMLREIQESRRSRAEPPL